MSATKEITYDTIMTLRRQIDEASQRGEDTTVLKEKLGTLTEAWSKQLKVEGKASLLKD
jgi:hypothetical protein